MTTGPTGPRSSISRIPIRVAIMLLRRFGLLLPAVRRRVSHREWDHRHPLIGRIGTAAQLDSLAVAHDGHATQHQ